MVFSAGHQGRRADFISSAVGMTALFWITNWRQDVLCGGKSAE